MHLAEASWKDKIAHMTVNTKDMVGVPVETRSGQPVGKVASFDLEQTTGHLVTLQVKPLGLVAGLTHEHVIVPWNAIVEMGPQKVVIADGAVNAAETLAQANPMATPTPTMMKER